MHSHFHNNVLVGSQPESPSQHIDYWRCTVKLRVEPHWQLPSLLVHWLYQERNNHAIKITAEMYTNKCTESQVYNDCSYRRNSVSEVLSEDGRLSIYYYFLFKVSITMLKNISRIFRIVLFIVSLHEENLLNVFILRYHEDLLICFKFCSFNNRSRVITVFFQKHLWFKAKIFLLLSIKPK